MQRLGLLVLFTIPIRSFKRRLKKKDFWQRLPIDSLVLVATYFLLYLHFAYIKTQKDLFHIFLLFIFHVDYLRKINYTLVLIFFEK